MPDRNITKIDLASMQTAMPDELSLCGPEVRAVFGGTGGWLVGTPTMMQLSLDVRKLTDAVEKLTAALAAKGA